VTAPVVGPGSSTRAGYLPHPEVFREAGGERRWPSGRSSQVIKGQYGFSRGLTSPPPDQLCRLRHALLEEKYTQRLVVQIGVGHKPVPQEHHQRRA